ncbi:ABC transporter permease [Aestuariivirga sp.]|jgi:peptide/nickel transport system permease protein|uniref:ABC transporter permease n=1 Tax=Aestuariivirga sp. TaxID=2650926 RepID=UPI0037851B4E
MFGLIVRRAATSLLTLILISVMVFIGLELMPGDACTAHLGRDGKGALLEACRARMGLDASPVARFAQWAGNLITGDLGTSMQRDKPIAEIVGWRLRNTLILTAASALMGIPLAVFLGIMAGLRRDGPLDLATSGTALVAMTIPEFVSATLLILVFAIGLGWTAGVVTIGYKAPVADMAVASVLPAVVLSMVLAAHIMRMVRASVIDVMDSDFVLMARLKGVPRRQIVLRHVVPNSLLPVISVIGLTIAWLLGGVVIVESVFNYPGLGRLAVDAVGDRDLPLVQAIALIFGITYVLTNLAADIAALLLNPRLRTYRA